MSAALDAMPSMIDRIRHDLVGLKMPRALEALESLGIVGHTHLDHRAPSYHLADHADHIHLVCRTCGRIEECRTELADGFVGNVLASSGFVADVTHMAIHGRCSACATS